MPVTTRNQSKNISSAFIQEVKKPVSNPVFNQQVIAKVRPDPNNLFPWFSSVIKEGLAYVDKSNNEKARLRSLIANPNSKKNENYKNQIRIEHYNAIRRVTELMYFVEQYYPEVRNLSPSMVRFGEVVYTKVQELYQQIRCLDPDTKPVTEDEKKCMVALIYTLQDVEKMIIPYLPQEHVTKRIRKFVDYTGMDTIEPESEYDGITNIWLDTTVFCDPDYEFEEDEDEDDDDEVDPYLVDEDEDDFEDEQEYKPWIRSYKTEDEEEEEDEHDYSEDEDYVPEDEEEEDEVVSEIATRVTVGRQAFREGNHTWFIYDDNLLR